MDHEQHLFTPDYGPFDKKWTIADAMAWFAHDDSRCHDEHSAGVLDGLDRALSFAPPSTSVPVVAAPPASARPRSTVLLLRALAMRLAGDPTLGAVRLGDLLEPAERDPAPDPAARRETTSGMRHRAESVVSC